MKNHGRLLLHILNEQYNIKPEDRFDSLDQKDNGQRIEETEEIWVPIAMMKKQVSVKSSLSSIFRKGSRIPSSSKNSSFDLQVEKPSKKSVLDSSLSQLFILNSKPFSSSTRRNSKIHSASLSSHMQPAIEDKESETESDIWLDALEDRWRESEQDKK
eukprot:NODE_36_length_31474_cov_0.342438.p19 type:complete len:158 gc:universal NODE_36_length_31474_cov_0.342438:17742-17269(-)